MADPLKLLADDDSDEAYRRRQARRAALAGLLLFAPWKKLRVPVAVAVHGLDDYFDDVDLAMERGALTKALKQGGATEPILARLIRVAMIGGYEDGGALVGKKPGTNYAARAAAEARDRAADASSQILRTSKQWLKANPDNSFALSKSRAERAVRYEAARAYYTGLQQALWGADMMKEWFTTSDNPCEECLDNEDQGPIPMEDQFQSGDYAPLAHLNCQCVLHVSSALEGGR